MPIIMVTSLDDMDSLSNAFVAGANDYITKPINRIELLARVRAALKLKGELERRQERERELLNFLSSWGDRRAALWTDEITGLFVGEVAEAYLTTTSKGPADDAISIIALMIDRYEAYRTAQGDEAAEHMLASVAKAVRATPATIGVVAAAYRNGLIVLVVPELSAGDAESLGESLCGTVSRLALSNSEAIVADHVTASVAVVSGRVRRGIDRAHLLTRAISNVKTATAAGGNRVVAIDYASDDAAMMGVA
jgi:PleD family two-component response regulator